MGGKDNNLLDVVSCHEMLVRNKLDLDIAFCYLGIYTVLHTERKVMGPTQG